MRAPGAEPGRPELLCGEVRTALLHSYDPVPHSSAAQLLKLRGDAPVLLSERPNLHARSPEVLTGVDCVLPSVSGARTRCVGTVRARACVNDGRVLQAAGYFGVAVAQGGERRQWSHYLARPGTVETFGRLRHDDIVRGFLGTGQTAAGVLDAGATAERLLTRVTAHPALDGNRRVPFKSRRTRLRWTARAAPDGEAVIEGFTLAEGGLRTLALRLPASTLAAPGVVAAFCEDIAQHDWLLTNLVHLVERGRLGSADRARAVRSLSPAIDQLLHLWMPGARVAKELSPLWDVLEGEPGFSRQWQTLVQRIRDQLALHTISLLHAERVPAEHMTTH
ncbi:hypothetical protein SRB5_12240 [Streptomyces sp. RB5]|uniref:Uncharacterized protein n=1 Tax=Streptomyces smaragdinus TaxID=2585196 RepID=A0A7K0CCD9_9ACTN|nr:SCO2521 family protein [Streptomyces smaragdinus]MQY11110.1 hypothetical protein [Streptomyces smaragdinus]